MASIKYKDKIYKYSSDQSWEKWKNILLGKTDKTILQWYYDNVLIDKPYAWIDVVKIVASLQKKFKHTNEQIKDIRKSSAQSVRGINPIEHQEKIIMFNLMYELNMGLDVINSLDWKDLLFFHGMVSEVNRLKADAHDRANKKRKRK